MSASQDTALSAPIASPAYPRATTVFGVVFLLSAGSLAYLLMAAPDSISWPFYAANFIFVAGLTQFGVCLQAIIRLAGGRWSRPMHRLGEIVTLAGAPVVIGGFLVVFFFGRESLFYWVGADGAGDVHQSPFLDETFLFWRNIVALLIFYSLAKLFFFLSLRPDISEADTRHGPWIRRTTCRFVLRLFPDGDGDTATRRLYYLSPVLLISGAIAQTFLAWDFGMMLVAHYHSTVYPMYYMIGNMLAGTALLYLLFLWLRRYVPADKYFGEHNIRCTGILLTAFTLLWLYLFWAQFFVSWFGNLDHELGVLGLQMFGHYGPLFWTMMLCVFGIPMGTLIFARLKRMSWSLAIIALIIVTGMWLNRYLMVVPGQIDGGRPFSSLADFIIALTLVSGFLFVLLWSFRLAPMLSGWQLNRDAD